MTNWAKHKSLLIAILSVIGSVAGLSISVFGLNAELKKKKLNP